MKKQIIHQVVVCDHANTYTNKRGESKTQTHVAFVGPATKAIYDEFKTLSDNKLARFNSYIRGKDCPGAQKEITAAEEPWTNPKTQEPMSTAKGWLVDPKHAPALITALKGVDMAAFTAEQEEKAAAREEKKAAKALKTSESGKARKVKPAPVKSAPGAADKAIALTVKALTKAGSWSKIPAAQLKAL